MKTTLRSLLRSALPCWLVLGVGGGFTARAQESPVPFPAGAPASFEFSLSNPGARSLGLGGAFVAIADDATAAFANPAGLVGLREPEVSIEGRRWEYATWFVEGGRMSGEPTGILLDTVSGPYRGESRISVNDVSFASFVYPGKTWSLAIYHHRQLDFRSRMQTNGIFGEGALPPFAPRHPDYLATNDSLIEGNGASLGLELNKEWSIGFGVVHFNAELANEAQFFLPMSPMPDHVFGPMTFHPATLVTAVNMGGDDTDWGLLAGVLWRPSSRWGIGAFYREGPELTVTLEVLSGPMVPGIPPGTLLFGGVVDPFEMPDVYGLGVAHRLADGAVTLSFEWDHVTYSSILRGFERDLGDTSGRLDDADELHFGFELALLEQTPVIALRAGAWLDPEHRIRGLSRNNDFLTAYFARGDDSWHWAAGVGVAFEHVQLDLAADFADNVDTMAMSAIFTF